MPRSISNRINNSIEYKRVKNENNEIDISYQQEIEHFGDQWESLIQEEMSAADYYFNSYAHVGIHEDMLKDEVRTSSYRYAIEQNPHLFEGKVVCDIGAGSGILSMFAARAGARKVYAMECSEIADLAERVVQRNNFAGVITFFKGRAEEIELPEPVDIIISEWMGYCLIYESMLDTVLTIRDKWLKKDGLIFPDHANLYIAGMEDQQYKAHKFDFWKNVYGFDFTDMQPAVMQEPVVDYINDAAVMTNTAPIFAINLYTAKVEDLDFVAPFKLVITRNDYLQAFVIWFDVTFGACHVPFSFSTSAWDRATHWKQTVLYTQDDMVGHLDDEVEGIIAIRKTKRNKRDLDIKLRYSLHGKIPVPPRTQFYRMR